MTSCFLASKRAASFLAILLRLRRPTGMWTTASCTIPVCYTVAMTDTSGLGRPHQDADQLRHTLTIHEVSARLIAAGVPRSERQIKRYCETGFLDAKKIPGPTGEQWFVAPAALPKLVGDLQQWQMQRTGHGLPRPGMSDNVTPENPHRGDTDAAGHGRPQPAMTDRGTLISNENRAVEPAPSGYVMQLEKRIEEKDDVIGLLKGQLVTKDKQLGDLSDRFTSLSDRFADTQKLIGAMQRMFAPLLGQGDPYSTMAEREVVPASPNSVDNSSAGKHDSV